MKKIYSQVKAFIATSSPWFILLCALWAAFLIVWNYGYGLEKEMVDDLSGFKAWRNHSLIYTLAYLPPLLMAVVFAKRSSSLKNPWFWVIALVSPWVFAYTSPYQYLENVGLQQLQPEYALLL